MAAASVQVEGLAELQRALKRAEGTLDQDLLGELREAGKLVEDEAHTLIREQRLVGGNRSTGRLDRLTRTAVRSKGSVVVRSGAKRAGFSYPRLLEFARGRAFLRPALERKREAVISRIERLLERMARKFDN
jgi:hypothetical protein